MEPAAIRHHDALHFGPGEDTVQNGIEQVVSQCPAHSIPCVKAAESIFWPADFPLQYLEVEGLGTKEGRSRTSGDVVAGEVHGVEEDRQAEDDASCTDTRGEEPLALTTVSVVCFRDRLTIEERDTHGPPNS